MQSLQNNNQGGLQMLNKNRVLSLIITFMAGLVMVTLTACATPNPLEPIRHGFELEVDKTAGKVSKLHYHYGVYENVITSTAFPWSTIKGADIPVPEYFEVSWESEDGIKHEAKVPVRGHLPSSVKNNNVRFVIMQDTVEAYLVHSTDFGEDKKRFY